jgi:hypothetical protein
MEMEREIDLNDRLRWIRELSCNSKRKERMVKELMEEYKPHPIQVEQMKSDKKRRIVKL